jgi:peptidoglycan/xylan/chitin deacetylase (PgdA/CDA1 family)
MLLERGYEFAAHGTHATRMLSSRMTPNEEQDAIAGAIEAVSKAAGVKPTGWISQDFGESTRTPFLVAEAGLSYIMDWANDDQPYAMKVGRPLISVPSQAEWDDVQLLWHRRVSLFRYAGIIEEAFTRLHEEGAQAGMYFGLHLHPWLMGAPQRIHQLEIALSRIASRKAVWWTTAGEVSRHFLSNPALLVPQPSR